MIFVRSDPSIKSLADLIAGAKSAPGSLNYSSPGVGTKSHLTGEQLKLRAGVDMVHIPSAAAVPPPWRCWMVRCTSDRWRSRRSSRLVKEGKFRALAVTGPEHWSSLPDVPTMVKSGFPGFVSDTFNALFAPAGTPPAIVTLLSRESQAALERRKPATRRAALAIRSSPERQSSWPQTRSEIPAVKELVGRLGIKPE